MKKYFISFFQNPFAGTNQGAYGNGIFEFDFDITANNIALQRAETIIVKEGDGCYSEGRLKIISILPL